MIFHASIPANDPQRVASFIAQIWGGESFRFPPWPGGYVAMSGDERGSTVEVYPRSHPISPGESGAVAQVQEVVSPSELSCFHMAVATARTAEEIIELARGEGWRALRCSRGGFFDVLEVWIENSLLIEVLTPEMQADYKKNINLDTWRWTKASQG